MGDASTTQTSLGYYTLGTAGFAALASAPTFTGTVTAPTVNASTALQIGGTAITSTAAELNYTDGVTSNIQTQLQSIIKKEIEHKSKDLTKAQLKLLINEQIDKLTVKQVKDKFKTEIKYSDDEEQLYKIIDNINNCDKMKETKDMLCNMVINKFKTDNKDVTKNYFYGPEEFYEKKKFI